MTANVLVVGDTLNLGGTEGQFVEIARGLARAGWGVHAACVRAEGPLRERLQAGGIDAWTCGPRSFKSARLGASILDVARYCRRHGITILHAFDFYSNIVGVLAARLARVPTVIASQRELSDLRPHGQRVLQRLTLRLSTRILVNSTAVGDRLGADQRLKARIVVVPNGVDVVRFSPEERSVNDAVTIGTLANARPEKGLDHLLRAASHLVRRHPRVRFRLWGDGPMRPNLEALADRLDIARQVQFCGRTAHPEQALRDLDIFVLPSLSEACPNAVLEAMATALPVVASRVGGIPDLVRHGETGYLVRPARPAELASAIEALIDDRRLASEMGSCGRARAVGEFGLDRLIDRIESVYRREPSYALAAAAR
jgi:glycosyltransferase involved in cell wall biosynthesis